MEKKDLIPNEPVEPEENPDEGAVNELVSNAVDGVSSSVFDLTKENNNIIMTVNEPITELTNISNTGLMTELIGILNDNIVNEIDFDYDGMTAILQPGDTTSNAKSKILPIIMTAADGGLTIDELIGKTFTMTVKTNNGDINYAIIVQ